MAGGFVVGGMGFMLWKCIRVSLVAIRARRTPVSANRGPTYNLRDFAADRAVELTREIGNDERYSPAQMEEMYATWLAAQG